MGFEEPESAAEENETWPFLLETVVEISRVKLQQPGFYMLAQFEKCELPQGLNELWEFLTSKPRNYSAGTIIAKALSNYKRY